MDLRTEKYAARLAALIGAETVSGGNKDEFYKFRQLQKKEFPNLFGSCILEDFDGSFLLKWEGKGDGLPILLMNHHDVVEATGEWKYPPFSGTVAEGRIWGRGVLDTKGGLFSMLQAAEELISCGFVPQNDVYFLSTCNEETSGEGGQTISKVLERRGIRFSFVLDEGGMILNEPIGGAKGHFAMVGVGEKGCTDLKFIARSKVGHASTPPKNSPLVRLGRFMEAVEKGNIFDVQISPTLHTMFTCLSTSMNGPLKFVLGNSRAFSPILKKVIPMISSTAGAMLKTTLAFTMASGSGASNVLPEEAYVIGNMRFSHHQGRDKSIEAVKRLAEKFDVETVVLSAGISSPVSNCNSEQFGLIKNAVDAIFPGVKTSPYIMTGASDSRFLSIVSDNCFRFTPFIIDDRQLDSVHGIDENLDLSCLAPAVDFYKYIIKEN